MIDAMTKNADTIGLPSYVVIGDEDAMSNEVGDGIDAGAAAFEEEAVGKAMRCAFETCEQQGIVVSIGDRQSALLIFPKVLSASWVIDCIKLIVSRLLDLPKRSMIPRQWPRNLKNWSIQPRSGGNSKATREC